MGGREGGRAEAVLGPPYRVGERELGAEARRVRLLGWERGSSFFSLFLWEAGGKPPDPQLHSGLAVVRQRGSTDRVGERELRAGGREGARVEWGLGPPSWVGERELGLRADRVRLSQ